MCRTAMKTWHWLPYSKYKKCTLLSGIYVPSLSAIFWYLSYHYNNQFQQSTQCVCIPSTRVKYWFRCMQYCLDIRIPEVQILFLQFMAPTTYQFSLINPKECNAVKVGRSSSLITCPTMIHFNFQLFSWSEIPKL